MESLIKYITIPYKDHGRGFDGIDCWGLVYLIYLHELGISLPTYSEDYQTVAESKRIGALVVKERKNWSKVNVLEKFDVVVIRMRGFPMHCGIYIGDGKFMHCLKGVNTTVEKIEASSWKSRIEGFYRYEK